MSSSPGLITRALWFNPSGFWNNQDKLCDWHEWPSASVCNRHLEGQRYLKCFEKDLCTFHIIMEMQIPLICRVISWVFERMFLKYSSSILNLCVFSIYIFTVCIIRKFYSEDIRYINICHWVIGTCVRHLFTRGGYLTNLFGTWHVMVLETFKIYGFRNI